VLREGAAWREGIDGPELSSKDRFDDSKDRFAKAQRESNSNSRCVMTTAASLRSELMLPDSPLSFLWSYSFKAGIEFTQLFEGVTWSQMFILDEVLTSSVMTISVIVSCAATGCGYLFNINRVPTMSGMTISVMTESVMTISGMTISVMTVSVMTISVMHVSVPTK
jgi:hypothetical protein